MVSCRISLHLFSLLNRGAASGSFSYYGKKSLAASPLVFKALLLDASTHSQIRQRRRFKVQLKLWCLPECQVLVEVVLLDF